MASNKTGLCVSSFMPGLLFWQTFRDTLAMQCRTQQSRIVGTRAITQILGAMLYLASSTATAASPVYSDKNANGTVIFSDAPLVNGQIVRTSYKTQYGRPVARSSCQGLSAAAMSKRAKSLDKTIESAAATHKVDAELLKAVAQVESCFDRTAVSRVGAQGVMQLMPATAKELGVTDSFNANQNINGGAHYLAKLLSRFKHDHRLALAAYNAGPGAVEKHNGVPPYPETQKYVKKVLDLYAR